MTNALSAQLAEQGINRRSPRGYMDTDIAASATTPTSDPAAIAKIAIDGIEADLDETVADDVTRRVQGGLAGGVAALYPELIAARTG